ncbi:TIR domain-containing protein [Streptomyces sp. NPDC001118]
MSSGPDLGHHSNYVNNNNGGNVNSGTQTFHGSTAAAATPAATPAGTPAATAAGAPAQGGPGPAPDRSRNVFVVHGRDEEARLKVYDLLRLLDLRPLEWEDLVRATGKTAPFLGEVIAQAPAQAQAALVLLTPDDIVQLHPDLQGPNEPPYESEPTGQPRPNVLIELGMVLMAYPERTLLVEIGAVRQISDIGGMNIIRFDGSATALGKIVERLKLAGCRVNDTGSDWRQTWPYRHLSAYARSGRSVPPAR